MGKNWVDWHAYYDDPASSLHRRLGLVQHRIRETLDTASPGLIRVISMCAGQSRDLLGVLPEHPRGADVVARLVELDPGNVELARQAAAGCNVTAIAADAGISTAYDGAVPANLVLACGVFGNVTDDDIRYTVDWLPRLCAPGATVIWTRHRRAPDRTGEIREWFAAAGFTEIGFDGPDDLVIGVGAHRFTSAPLPFEPGVRLFEFVPERV